MLSPHISDDRLEMYALSAQADASVEEHLLVCRPCRDRFDKICRFILAARAAIKPDSVSSH